MLLVRIPATCLFLLGAVAVALPVPVQAQAPTPSVCDRTDVVRDVIVNEVSGVSNCANVTTAHLAAITELEFSDVDGTGIRSLQSGDFAGLTGLQILILHGNNPISSGRTLTLPADIFDGLTSLEDLDLGRNHIPSLPAGVFDDLTALTDLHLGSTYVETVPVNVFDNLVNLNRLLFASTATILPPSVFDGLTKLVSLSLGSEDAQFVGHSSLRSDLFDELGALEELEILGHNLSGLPADIFDELTSLTTLLIGHNGLTSLPVDIFDELTALTELQVFSEEFASLPAGIFDQLTSLRVLGLHSNRLQTLPDDLFEQLTLLIGLFLADNPGLSTFVPTALAGADRDVPSGATVTLDATASGGAWGTNVTYAWTQTRGAPVTLTGAATAIPSFTAPNSWGVLEFELVVTGVSCGFSCFGGQRNPLTSTDRVRVTVGPPIVTINPLSPHVDEDAGEVWLTVSLNRPAESAVSVGWHTVSQTAHTPEDYIGRHDQTVMFGVGEDRKTISLVIVDDEVHEGLVNGLHESFLVSLKAGSDYRFLPMGESSFSLVRIVDNDPPDVTPPSLVEAAVEGDELFLEYDELLDRASIPARGDFVVTADGGTIDVSRVVIRSGSVASTVTLDLADPVQAGQTVRLDYTPGSNPIRDEAGNEAPALSGERVINDTGADTRPPRLTGATVNGATLVLAYDETLDDTSRPARSDFAVKAAGSGIGVSGVRVGGSSVTLTLASAVAANQTVTLDYTPGTNPIRDEAGNEAAALSGESVTNSTAGDTRPPRLTGATVNGATLVLAYDEALDGASRPATGDFAVTAAGSGIGVNRVDVGGSSVTLTLASAVAANQAVTLDYTPGASPIRDEAGNEAAALSGRSVTNNTAGDTRAPQLTGATVNGATLVLAYDEALDGASRPAADDFAVTAGGSGHGVNRVDVGGSSVTLTLLRAVAANQAVTLDYTPGANPIRDEAGNDAAALSGRSVTNNTPGDTRAPRLTGATVNGATLVLAYDEALDGASRPATGDFSVTADGYGKEVTRVDVGGSSVTLTLAGWVEANQVVKLNYTPGANPIQDEAGNDAAALSGQTVTNNTPADPGGEPRVSINPDLLSVDEDAGNAELTVSLDRRPSASVSVAWYTQDNSAEAPGDYTARDEAVTFAAGEDRKTISVHIVNDAIREDPVHGNHENFFVILRNGPGYVVSDSSYSIVVIVDDDGASGDSAGTAQDALALLDGLTPDEASAALLGARSLSEAQLDALDRLGNRNGRYDLGDLLSWTERCRKGEANCGSDPLGPSGASWGLLFGAAAAGQRRRSGRRGRLAARRRPARRAACAVAVPLVAVAAWSCTGDLAGPPTADPGLGAPAVEVPVLATPPKGPGILNIEWTGPASGPGIGILLELEGPGITDIRPAPALKLYHFGSGGKHRIVVAGALAVGPPVRFQVPDRSRLHLYRVRVLQVTGQDYGLRDPTEYRAVVALN